MRDTRAFPDREAGRILSSLRRDGRVREMKSFTQHGSVSTFEHCRAVTKLSLGIDRRLHLHSDKKVLITGAMLHDYFLYDWHDKARPGQRIHGYTHAAAAAKNARRHFDIDGRTHHVIWSHMWPLNITRLPRSREAWIVCTADKIVSLRETFMTRGKAKKRRRERSSGR